jgi:hypothetical protein
MLITIGTLFNCGGIQGYQARRRKLASNWLARVAALHAARRRWPAAGHARRWQMISLGVAILVPTIALLAMHCRRTSAPDLGESLASTP